MKITYTEIKGTVAKLGALARKLGFKYRPGDRVFRRRHGSDVSVRAYRTMYPGNIHVQRQRLAA
jgi:hypothetical protein